MKVLVGIKKGMTRVYDGEKIVPVTILDTSGAVISNVAEKGMELGIGKQLKKPNKALSGKYKTLEVIPVNRVWVKGDYDVKVADKIVLTDDLKGRKVAVVSTSKGKGFAGVVKRWGFHGGSRTHGQSDRQRAPGAIGAGTDPGRILKGKRMGGRMGGERMTVNNKKIVDIKGDYLLISGAVPGNKGSVVTVKVIE